MPHCPVCGKKIEQQTIDQIVDKVMSLEQNTKIQILSPIVKARKGEHVKELDSVRKSGFVRVRVDGIIYDLSEEIKLEKNKKHSIDVVVDRLVIKDSIRSRLADSIETSSTLSGGLTIISIVDGEDILFSQNYACPEHGISIDELTPRMFSFNSPFGACKKCTGLGVFMKVDPNLILPNKELSIRQGAIKGSGWAMEGSTIATMYFEALSKKYKFSLDKPIKDLPKKIIDIILYGTNGEKIKVTRKSEYGSGTYSTEFEGIINNLERRFRETQSNWIKEEIESYMSAIPCDECGGQRLSKESLSVLVGGINISELCRKSINDAFEFIMNLNLTKKER